MDAEQGDSADNEKEQVHAGQDDNDDNDDDDAVDDDHEEVSVSQHRTADGEIMEGIDAEQRETAKDSSEDEGPKNDVKNARWLDGGTLFNFQNSSLHML